MDFVFLYDLTKVLSYLDQHFREDIGVNECSDLIGYSPWYTGRLFKRYFGETIGDYVRRLRMTCAKEALLQGKSVKDVAVSLSYTSPDGFSRAFKKQFGITPIQYVSGEPLREKYATEYQYNITPEEWRKGENLYDGVWEYAYYNPKEKKYELMCWDGSVFIAPFTIHGKSSTSWYCRNRDFGRGIHPGRVVQAVRTFRCPSDGVVDVLFIVGRKEKRRGRFTPIGVQLFHNDTLLVPDAGMIVLKNTAPIVCQATCTVKKGDRISLHVDAMGDIDRSGLYLYRQWVGYRNIPKE